MQQLTKKCDCIHLVQYMLQFMLNKLQVRMDPLIKIFSTSCRFLKTFTKIVCWSPPPRVDVPSPGSAPGYRLHVSWTPVEHHPFPPDPPLVLPRYPLPRPKIFLISCSWHSLEFWRLLLRGILDPPLLPPQAEIFLTTKGDRDPLYHQLTNSVL